MSQQRKRLHIETLFGSSSLSVTQISKKLGVRVATIYRVNQENNLMLALNIIKELGGHIGEIIC